MFTDEFCDYCGGEALVDWTDQSFADAKRRVKQIVNRHVYPRSRVGYQILSVLTRNQLLSMFPNKSDKELKKEFTKTFGMKCKFTHVNPNTGNTAFTFIGTSSSVKKALEN